MILFFYIYVGKQTNKLTKRIFCPFYSSSFFCDLNLHTITDWCKSHIRFIRFSPFPFPIILNTWNEVFIWMKLVSIQNTSRDYYTLQFRLNDWSAKFILFFLAFDIYSILFTSIFFLTCAICAFKYIKKEWMKEWLAWIKEFKMPQADFISQVCVLQNFSNARICLKYFII